MYDDIVQDCPISSKAYGVFVRLAASSGTIAAFPENLAAITAGGGAPVNWKQSELC